MKKRIILLVIVALVGCQNGEKQKKDEKNVKSKAGQKIKQKNESKEVIMKKQGLVIEKIKKRLLPNVPESRKELSIDDIKSYVRGWNNYKIKNKIISEKLDSYFNNENWVCIWKGYFNHDKKLDYFVVIKDKKYYRAITKGIILGAKGEHILEINMTRGFFNKKGDILALYQIGIFKGDFRSIRVLPAFNQDKNIDNSPILMLSYDFIDEDGYSVFFDVTFRAPVLEWNNKKDFQRNPGSNYYEIFSPNSSIRESLSYIKRQVEAYRQAKKAGTAIKAFNMSPYPKDYKDIANMK